jgi:hypothetical protein
MARTITIPQATYQGSFGPFEIDNIFPQSTGCTLSLARPNGTWPGTSDDLVVEMVVDYRYDGVWTEVGRFQGFGGTLPPRFGQVPQVWKWSLTWPGHNENGVIVLDIPDAARIHVTVPNPLTTSGEFKWLS